jgi:hypothetical protein
VTSHRSVKMHRIHSRHQEKNESRARKEKASGLGNPGVTTTWDTARGELTTEVGDDRRSLNAGKAAATATWFARTER